MNSRGNFTIRASRVLRNLVFGSEGAQLLEFALVLPILLVFSVGIMDFGQAYNLKQKLNNASREGARFAAAENSGAGLVYQRRFGGSRCGGKLLDEWRRNSVFR